MNNIFYYYQYLQTCEYIQPASYQQPPQFNMELQEEF